MTTRGVLSLSATVFALVLAASTPGNSVDVKVAPSLGARAGVATAGSSDLNGDGFADLAVGVPSEDLEARADVGVVEIHEGSSQGLATGSSWSWLQDSEAHVAEGGDRFGSALALGDYNGDGVGDLAAGAPYEDDGPSARDAGSVYVLLGAPAPSNRLVQRLGGSPADAGEVPAGALFGSALVAGDFNADGWDDLAVGAPEQRVRGHVGAGSVLLFHGSAVGLPETPSGRIDAATSGVPGRVRSESSFGATLAVTKPAGEVGSSLVIGAPFHPGRRGDAVGAVFVIPTANSGLSIESTTRTTYEEIESRFEDESPLFGEAITAVDMTAGPRVELVVGAPGRPSRGKDNAGAIYVFSFSPSGRISLLRRVTQASEGVPGKPHKHEYWGSSLASEPAGEPKPSLAVGGYDTVGGRSLAGGVTILHGGQSRRARRAAGFFTPASEAFPGRPTRGAFFGFDLSFLQTAERRYLVVGAPGERVRDTTGAGAVYVIQSGPGRFRPLAVRRLSQEGSAMDGGVEHGDGFGHAFP